VEDTRETRQEEGDETSYTVEPKKHRFGRFLDERPRAEERTAGKRVADKRLGDLVEEKWPH
jgi:hypothetical protein